MKIDTDLRLAIRSAERAQPNVDSWGARRDAEKASIEALMKRKPAIRKKVESALRIIEKSNFHSSEARAVLANLGIGSDGDRFGDEDKFVKSGGKLPGPLTRNWKYDQVMTELAAADPKRATAILKKYGINWQ